MNKKQNIAILGAGESGVGAALLAQAKGHLPFVSDMGKIKLSFKTELEENNLEYEEGMHSEERILAADLVIKSPGIPNKAPIIKKLKEKGIPVISEIEFAGRYSTKKMICITGSNGKTTTTLWIHHILTKGGKKAELAGNVGKSLARQVILDEAEMYVVELSSFN